MDDCLAQVALDFGGRSWLVWEAKFKREKIGDVPTEMFEHFSNLSPIRPNVTSILKLKEKMNTTRLNLFLKPLQKQ